VRFQGVQLVGVDDTRQGHHQPHIAMLPHRCAKLSQLTTVGEDVTAVLDRDDHVQPGAASSPVPQQIRGRYAMSITFEDSNERLRWIRLTGRLDIPGIDTISTTFAELSASTRRQIVVDLSGVSFLVSFGIRELITNAKIIQKRGGRMVIFVGDNKAVHKTLETTGIDELIPTFTDAAQANRAALE
jgi:anti-anti-sigma factor